ANMQSAINARLAASGMTGSVTVDLPTLIPGTRQLRVTSNGGSVVISVAQQNDAAVALQLGVANGGVEISGWSRIRPAPTGIVARLNINPDDLARFGAFVATDQNAMGAWSLND